MLVCYIHIQNVYSDPVIISSLQSPQHEAGDCRQECLHVYSDPVIISSLQSPQHEAGDCRQECLHVYSDPVIISSLQSPQHEAGDCRQECVNPLTPIVAFWRHTYFRHHKFIKKC